MATIGSLACSKKFTIIYIDESNIIDETIFTPYDIIDSTINNKRFGISISGYKDSSILNRAHFFIFGGKDEDGTMYNNLIKMTFDITGGGPILSSEIDITCETKPSKRYLSNLKTIGKYLYLFGGINESGIFLSDLWKYSIDDSTQEEISLSVNIPTGRILSGGSS